jgi:hypothetical protein
VADHFTKRASFIPLADTIAPTLADALVSDFLQFGIPEQILSDMGKNYMSQVLELVWEKLDVERLSTTPYHPMADGLSERLVRTAKQMLACFVNDNQSDWDVLLPFLSFAYNTSLHASTLHTPFEMTFGHKAKLPLDLIFAPQEELELSEIIPDAVEFDATRLPDLVSCYNEKLPVIALDYCTNLQNRFRTVFAHASSSREIAVERFKFNYERRLNPVTYCVGDLVLTDHPQLKIGRLSGIAHRFHGPFVVTECVGKVNYIIRSLVKRRAKKFMIHHNRLKKYFGRYNDGENTAGESSQSQSTPAPVAKRAYRKRIVAARGPVVSSSTEPADDLETSPSNLSTSRSNSSQSSPIGSNATVLGTSYDSPQSTPSIQSVYESANSPLPVSTQSSSGAVQFGILDPATNSSELSALINDGKSENDSDESIIYSRTSSNGDRHTRARVRRDSDHETSVAVKYQEPNNQVVVRKGTRVRKQMEFFDANK